MPTLLEQVRAASAEEREAILTELVTDAFAKPEAPAPRMVYKAGAPVAYITPTVRGMNVFPEITDEVLAKVGERARNPGKLLTVEQFLQRLDAHIAERQRAEGESPR